MESTAEPSKPISGSKDDSKPPAIPDLLKKLGSSADGLSQPGLKSDWVSDRLVLYQLRAPSFRPPRRTKGWEAANLKVRNHAVKALAQFGPNDIEEKKSNERLKFLNYFWGPFRG
jgi:hypothetical protein